MNDSGVVDRESVVEARLAALKLARKTVRPPEVTLASRERDGAAVEYTETEIFVSNQGTVSMVHDPDGNAFIAKQYRGASALAKLFQQPDWADIDSIKSGEREIAILRAGEKAQVRGMPRLEAVSLGSMRVPIAIMTMLPGESLETAVQKNTVFTTHDISHILASAGEIVDTMHRLGPKPVLHRDLNRNNVLYDHRSGSVGIVDWDTARASNGTETGTVISTRYFTSPELILGEPGTRASDVYSLAQIGKMLLLGSTFTAMDGDPLPEQYVGLNAPAALIAALKRGSNPDPAQRFATVREFMNALGNEQRSYPITVAASVRLPSVPAADKVAAKILEADKHAAEARRLGQEAAVEQYRTSLNEGKLTLADALNEEQKLRDPVASQAFAEHFVHLSRNDLYLQSLLNGLTLQRRTRFLYDEHKLEKIANIWKHSIPDLEEMKQWGLHSGVKPESILGFNIVGLLGSIGMGYAAYKDPGSLGDPLAVGLGAAAIVYGAFTVWKWGGPHSDRKEVLSGKQVIKHAQRLDQQLKPILELARDYIREHPESMPSWYSLPSPEVIAAGYVEPPKPRSRVRRVLDAVGITSRNTSAESNVAARESDMHNTAQSELSTARYNSGSDGSS